MDYAGVSPFETQEEGAHYHAKIDTETPFGYKDDINKAASEEVLRLIEAQVLRCYPAR
jgi:hypothetical protein